MPNPFLDPDAKPKGWFKSVCPATKDDLDAMEARLTNLIKEGQKREIQGLIEQLNKSATGLQTAVEQNKG